ncbi:MAG TPA: ABC transporter ATP-binding protein [Polyangiales bacterium]|nr:ABC transporter ATP-binding protein [Polyangiales bacterium]
MAASSSAAARVAAGVRPGWQLIRAQMREQRAGVALGVGAGLCWTAGKIAVPMLVRKAIDHGIAAGSQAAPLRWALWVGVAGVVAACFTGARRYLGFREGRRAETALRERVFEQVLRLHFAYHDRTQTGELMTRAHSDLLQIQNFVTLIPLTLSNFVIVLSVTVIMASIHPLLTLFALGALPFVNLLGRRFSERLHPMLRGLQEQTAELASVVEESVAGVRVVKGFGAEQVQLGRLRKESADVFGMAMAAARVRSTFLPAIEILPGIGQIAVLAYGGHLVLDGALTIGTLIMFNFYVILLVNPLRMLGQIIAQAERAATSADRVAQVLDVAPAIADPRDRPARELPPRGPGRGEIQLSGVSFGYGGAGSARVLDGLDLHVAGGQSLALVGETGSGKSTVAKLIARFYDADAGSVKIDGCDVRELSVSSLRSQIGFVFEDTFLFSDTVAANIAFSRPEAAMVEIERAATLAGAHDFICELPEGYGTLLGERGFSLSGGQRQRIAIARAILADPRVLILDDATSAVDPEKEHEIRAAMAEVMRGRTTIVIAHRPVTIALADRVVLLQDGRVVSEGTHQDLLAHDPGYRRVLAAVDEAAE